MSSAPAADEIWSDARWLAQALDPAAGLARIIEMSAEDYRAASFLDDRMLQRPVTGHIVPWSLLAEAVPARARRDARWIFHIGHVGSTLVARLLGELDGVLSVREPRLLRDVATVDEAGRAAMIGPVRALFSRAFAPAETALVKATSFVSEIAAELVPGGERALFMYAAPRSYIETILAGENSRRELPAMAEIRMRRMRDRVGPLEAQGSEARLAAAAWACEMTALEAAALRMADRQVMWADFDRMLDDMESALGRVAAFFGFTAAPDRLREVLSGPLMRRYSKAPEYEYSPGLRRALLAEARREHEAEIDSAIGMLEQAAERSELLARALSRTQVET